jgi:hypothetical protein
MHVVRDWVGGSCDCETLYLDNCSRNSPARIDGDVAQDHKILLHLVHVSYINYLYCKGPF